MTTVHDDEILGKAYDARLMRRLLGYLRPYRASVAVAFAAILVGAGASLTQPYLVRIAIDDHIAQGTLAGLGWLALSFFALLMIAFVAEYVQTWTMLMTGQRAACWAVVTPNGRFGYVTNAGTGNISGFALGQGGAATLLDADGVTAVTGGNPTDAALSHNGRFLYVRVAAMSTIAIFAIGADGALTPLPALPGTPAGLAGLAAY